MHEGLLWCHNDAITVSLLYNVTAATGAATAVVVTVATDVTATVVIKVKG